jgi:hypothetical protein
MKKTITATLSFFYLLAGCEVFIYDVGKEGKPCFGNGTCEKGLYCCDGICRAQECLSPDGGDGRDGGDEGVSEDGFDGGDPADSVDDELDAGGNAGRDGGDDGQCFGPPQPPRPLSPENGAYTGSIFNQRSYRPKFRWLAPPDDGCGALTYDLQVDDSCTTPGFSACNFPSPEINQAGLTDTSFTPTSPLSVSMTPPVGRRYYWRVRACRAGQCSAWSEVRYVNVGRLFDDFNGDGYSDVIVGAYAQDRGATDEGNAFVYYGSASGIPTTPSVTLDNPANQQDGEFGFSVASAGDVNGDGYSDVIVGAWFQDAGATNEGNAFIYYGSASGIPTTPSVTLDNPANQASGNFGCSVASAGDVNGDGYSDVIVGALAQNAGAAGEGNAFIYYGSASGIPTTPSVTLDNPANQASGNFGFSVASAGDVNGDGYSDVIVGAPGQDAGATNEGNAFVYYGSASGISTTPSVTLDNPANQTNGWFGWSVASAGYVNGDGFSDVIVGAPEQDAGATDEGNAFVYYGSASGISTTPSVTLDNPANQEGAYFGYSVASAGDANGDGFSDVIVGAVWQDAGATDEGNAFVYYGSASGIPTTPSITLDNPQNQVGGYFGFSVASAGDVNGDGYSDVIVGAYMQDAGAQDEGNAFVYYGSPSGIPTTPSVTLDNPENHAGGRFGSSVASVFMNLGREVLERFAGLVGGTVGMAGHRKILLTDGAELD